MPPTAVILDEDGDIVWWYTLEGVDNLARARISVDGRSMLLLDLNLAEDPEVVYAASDAYMGRMWPHANAIDYLVGEDAYLVSFLALDGIVRIDRGSGEVDWRLGGCQTSSPDLAGGTQHARSLG